MGDVVSRFSTGVYRLIAPDEVRPARPARAEYLDWGPGVGYRSLSGAKPIRPLMAAVSSWRRRC